LILALELVRQSIPNVLYSIVGDGEERASLEELVRERGLAQLVQFRGESSDDELVRCYQQCDMFVLPNHEVNGDIEGFGMVLVEAQACGKPVVAGDSGGTRETMRVGETGYVVRCQAIDELASIVIDLLADDVKRSRMGYAARSWAVSQFDWVSLAAKAQDIFARFLPPTRIVAPPTAFPEADRPIGTAHETTFPAASKLN
jgi:phosphatidylinositol alpha-1,6-mannosyltransferase